MTRGKKISGRKRHVLTDTLGLVWAVLVTAANVSDPAGARNLLERVAGKLPRMRLLWADAIYQGQLPGWIKRRCGWLLQVVKKLVGQTTFQVLPRRWVVERTFGWWNKYRRLSKDYEVRTDSSEAMIHIAMIHLMVRRLAL
jgi:putative transposase